MKTDRLWMARWMKFQMINFRIKKPPSHTKQELLMWVGKHATPPCLWGGRREPTSGPTGKSMYSYRLKEKHSHPENQS